LTTKGFGTEQIEQELVTFPNAKLGGWIRIQLEVNLVSKNYRQFKNREMDVLVGTQMLAKGLDFDNVVWLGL
jgi:primosomal protein N' (replication factor Y)